MSKILLFIALFSVFSIPVYAQWSQLSTGFPIESTGVRYLHVVDQNTLWITGYNGVNSSTQTTAFAVSDNGGTSFSNGIPAGYSGYGSSMIHGIDAQTAWMPVYGPSGGGAILKTTNGGISWTEQTTASFSEPGGFPNVVYFWDANNGFCMGDPNNGYFEIYTTSNGGDNWVRVPQTNIPDPVDSEYGTIGYFSVVGDTVWFTSNKSKLYRSVNKGLNWIATTTPVGNYQAKVFFKDAQHGILYNNQNTPVSLYESADGGSTWAEISHTGQVFDVDICYVPGTFSTWVSTGNNAGASYSFDGGHSWELFQKTTTMNFLAVRFFSPYLGWSGDFTSNQTTGGINKYEGNLQPLANDVGVLYIDMPPVIEPGTIVPQVTFKNFGGIVQSFDVSLSISPSYTSVKHVSNLPPFGSIRVEFDAWDATYGNYKLTVHSLLNGDQQPANDEAELEFEIMDLTEAYCYVVFDPSENIPTGPAKIFLEAPHVILSLDNQTSDNFIFAGTWGPENKWYGAVYYDPQTQTGGELVSIDPQTGERTIVGDMGSNAVHGMSYDFTNNTLYGITFEVLPTDTTAVLYTIDLQNAQLTQVGLTNAGVLINLACDSLGNLFSIDILTDMFGSLDKSTGLFTPLFPISFNATYAQDMEFDRYTNTCYMAAYNGTNLQGEFYRIDVSSKTLTLIDTISGGSQITGFAIPFDPSDSIGAADPVSLKIYPNPSGDFLYLLSQENIKQLRLFDGTGKLILVENMENSFYEVNLQSLGKGLYIIEIATEKGTVKRKFTKL
ncbi:MAG: T9SS type A sorting domain-containing protein [Bacteroidales bacterium]|nr:T9SS type A sorting domain-containing protein [Bacteroidales bacterium]MCF8458477.1 T9SS type A sorting domain-containing protein [Bacteroidales bacterium]